MDVYDTKVYLRYIGGTSIRAPTVALRMSFRAMMPLSETKEDVLLYDSSISKYRPAFEKDYNPYKSDGGSYPLLRLIDCIRDKVYADDRLFTYYLSVQDYTYVPTKKYVIMPLLCKNSHKPRQMILAEKMVICEICGRILTDKEIDAL